MEKGVEMQRQITKRAAAVQHLRLRRIYSGFYVFSVQGFGDFLIDVRPAIHLQEESETLHRPPHSPKESVAGRGNWSGTSEFCEDPEQASN